MLANRDNNDVINDKELLICAVESFVLVGRILWYGTLATIIASI